MSETKNEVSTDTVDEKSNMMNEGTGARRCESSGSLNIAQTALIMSLLLIPLSLGLKISLLSRDLYVRAYFTSITGSSVFQVTDVIWGLTNALMPVGGCIGALGISYVSDRIGLKYSTFICMAVGLFGEVVLIISYYSKMYWLLVLSRLIDGLCSGGSMNVGLCYMFELLPPKLIPFCLTSVQFCVNAGIVISAVFSLDVITNKSWIVTAIAPTVTQFVCLALLLLLPESPRFVYEANKNVAEAKAIISNLRGPLYKGVDQEIQKLVEDAELKKNIQKVSVMTFLCTKPLRSSIIVMTVVQCSQQLSGVNAIINYANSFMREAKYDQEDYGSLIMLSLCLIGSTVFTKIIPRVGGKTMLLIGYGGMTLSFIIAFCFWMAGKNFSIGIVVCLGAFLFMFQAGPGPIPWIITMQTYRPEQILSGQGFFTFCNWFANALVAVTYMASSKYIGFYVAIVFACINLFVFCFLYFFMVESKGKTQAEVMASYQKIFPCLRDPPS